jgi:hypothetical protein
VHDDANDEENGGDGGAAIENEENRPEDKRSGNRARVQVLIENVECRTGDGERKKDADQGNGTKLCGGCGKTAPGEGETGPEEQEGRGALADQLDSRNRDVRCPNEERHQAVEDAGLHLQGEKLEVVWIESRMQASLDRGEVNGIIFHAGVITFEDKRPQGNQ